MTKSLILVYPKALSKSDHSDIPMSLLYLANAAKSLCDNISLYDENVANSLGLLEMCSQETKTGKLVVGINCLVTTMFTRVRELAQEIKAHFPDVYIVVGGIHPTIYGEEIISHCSEIDAVAVGESEDSFPQLLAYFFADKNGGGVNWISSCYVRTHDGTIHFQPRTSYIHDIDSLKADYSIVDFSKYEVNVDGWYNPDNLAISSVQAMIMSSRSCPIRCNFCAMRFVMGDKCRARSAANVFNEIKFLYDNYGVNYFMIEDDNFTLNRKRAIDICQRIIDSGIKAYFEASHGLYIKSLDEELVQLMRKAGFIRVNLGVESGNDYIRNKVIGKHVSHDEIVSAFHLTRKYGIIAGAFIIVGFPEETNQSLSDTYDLINEIEADKIKIFIAQPFWGTELYKQCERDGLFTDNMFISSSAWDGKEITNDIQKKTVYNGWTDAIDENQQFYIQPYALQLKELAVWYKKIVELARQKSAAWIEHIKRLNESTII